MRPNHERRRSVVLDVDVGIDDALMILYLLSEPEVEVVAIGATHGNCTAADSARNALRTLEAVGVTTVPVALGPESPLETPLSAPQVHGYDGLGDIGPAEPSGQVSGESAIDQLVRLGKERPGELDLIAVGSLTNLAGALKQDPESLKRYRSMTYLGTLSQYPVKPPVFDYNDANVYFDPEAVPHGAFVRYPDDHHADRSLPPRGAGGSASRRAEERHVAPGAIRLEDPALLLQLLSGAAGPLVGLDARSAGGGPGARSVAGDRSRRTADRGRAVQRPSSRGGPHRAVRRYRGHSQPSASSPKPICPASSTASSRSCSARSTRSTNPTTAPPSPSFLRRNRNVQDCCDEEQIPLSTTAVPHCHLHEVKDLSSSERPETRCPAQQLVIGEATNTGGSKARIGGTGSVHFSISTQAS